MANSSMHALIFPPNAGMMTILDDVKSSNSKISIWQEKGSSA